MIAKVFKGAKYLRFRRCQCPTTSGFLWTYLEWNQTAHLPVFHQHTLAATPIHNTDVHNLRWEKDVPDSPSVEGVQLLDPAKMVPFPPTPKTVHQRPGSRSIRVGSSCAAPPKAVPHPSLATHVQSRHLVEEVQRLPPAKAVPHGRDQKGPDAGQLLRPRRKPRRSRQNLLLVIGQYDGQTARSGNRPESAQRSLHRKGSISS